MKKEQSGQGNNIPGFQRLHVWQKAKDLALNIYAMSTTGAFATDFSLRDQIRRAAVSVPSNIAEGEWRDTNKDSIRFFHMAKGSLAELWTQLIISQEVGYIKATELKELQITCGEIAAMLGVLIKYRRETSNAVPPPQSTQQP